MAKIDLTSTLLILEPFGEPWGDATPTSHLDLCLMAKGCGGLLEAHPPAKGGGENAFDRGGKMPPLSALPLFSAALGRELKGPRTPGSTV